jgi:hypothetical protein
VSDRDVRNPGTTSSSSRKGASSPSSPAASNRPASRGPIALEESWAGSRRDIKDRRAARCFSPSMRGHRRSSRCSARHQPPRL